MPRRYKPIEECRPEISDYADELAFGTDDDDTDKRQSNSTKRYEQDLRWFDAWLDAEDIDSAHDVTPAEANRLGRALSTEFSGTTGRYRWDRIYKMYTYFTKMQHIDENPLETWNDSKTERWGLTKTTAQSRQSEEGNEGYAVSQEEVRMMEENVGRNRVRDQLLIRLLYQSAMRRGEAEALTLDMMDRNRREITIPASVAKNDKSRVVVWQPNLDGLLQKWLDRGYRDEYLAGGDHNHLFIGERGAPLSADAINDIVVNAADRAGINEKTHADANAPLPEDGSDPEPNRWKITAHSLRKGAATAMIQTDADLLSVSTYLGHSDPSVTQTRYLSYDPRAGVNDGHQFGPE